MAAEGIGHAKRKAQDISSTVQESVGPILSKVSDKLPGAIQKVSGTVEEVAGGAESVAASSWEWTKNEVERRRK